MKGDCTIDKQTTIIRVCKDILSIFSLSVLTVLPSIFDENACGVTTIMELQHNYQDK